MPPTQPWTDTEDDQLRNLHADGLSLTETAKRMHRSKSTVNRAARRLGLHWDRTKTAAATAAVIADGRTRRAALEQRFLDEAEKSLDRMWTGHEIGAFGGMDGQYKHAYVDEPSPADRKAIMQTAASASMAAAKLAEQNAGTEVDAAKGALTRLKVALETAINDD